MVKITWSPNAIDDINSISEYISKDSKDRASLFVLRVFESVQRLIEYPLSGRIIPELMEEDKREIIYGNYRIMYQLIDKENIWISAVYHGSVDVFNLN